MIELLSGTMCYLWEINGNFFDKEDEAEIAATDAGIKLQDVNMVQALKQKGYPDENVPNYYLVRKVSVSNQETIRKAALAKLSPIERKALGL